MIYQVPVQRMKWKHIRKEHLDRHPLQTLMVEY